MRNPAPGAAAPVAPRPSRPRRRRVPRGRGLARTVLPVLLLGPLVLSGCAAGPEAAGTPRTPAASTPATASPSPSPTPDAAPTTEPAPAPSVAPAPAPAAVPRRDSSIEAQTAPAQLPPPVRLQVPDVQLDMPVLAMGVDDDGAMALPEDTADAGWYRFGPAPGAPGTTVVAAHVDSLVHGLGAFARLRDVPVGAVVTVTTADGTDHGYRVDRVERTPKTEVPLDLLFDRTGPERLVLVTCGGEFDRSTGHYLDNVVVTVLPIP